MIEPYQAVGLVPTVVPFTGGHYPIAVDAYTRYGKGRHPAALSFRDCLTYAVCRHPDQPLLCTGRTGPGSYVRRDRTTRSRPDQPDGSPAEPSWRAAERVSARGMNAQLADTSEVLEPDRPVTLDATDSRRV